MKKRISLIILAAIAALVILALAMVLLLYPMNENEPAQNVVYSNAQQAVYLIDDNSMSSGARGVSYIASGWTYEDPNSSSSEHKDYSTNYFRDKSSENGITARKTVRAQTSGRVVYEGIFSLSDSGFEVLFEDTDRNVLFGILCDDETYIAIGKEMVDTGRAFKPIKHRFSITFDLDARTADVVLNGKAVGTYELSDASSLAGVVYHTTDEGILNAELLATHMYTQYAVNDTFRTATVNETLYGWETSSNVSVQKQASDYDSYSAAMTNTGFASKSFDAVSGKFVYETFVKIPEEQAVTLELKNGDSTAVMVEISGGRITSEGTVCREYDSTLWNLVRIEGDTEAGKALVRINGKMEGTEVTLSEAAIDTVRIASSGSGKLWFDDVQVYNVYDYEDYVPEPVPVNDDDYYLGMSICSLWREGHHSGWDFVSPYDDLEPILGYYDEGLPEVADWEIKFLAEHGYDFQHFCWYGSPTSFTDGIKEPSNGFALHDGFMNAKYSDMMKFAIMWENYSSPADIKDYFLEVIWPYWCEWYFSDSRYMSVENKAVLTIYRHPRFIEQMGGMEEAKAVIAFMREDIKRFGYDGLILLGTSSGSEAENIEAKELGIDGFIAYHFGENAFSADYQIACMTAAYDNGYTPFLPSVGVGYNDIGWTEDRNPLATTDEFTKVLEWTKEDYLPKLAQREGEDWMGKFVMTNTWNEFGEGHYVFPTNLNKFGYLDCVREVFSLAAGEDSTLHTDAEPTENQKERLSYLYETESIPLRRTLYVSDDAAIANNVVIKSWNFENEEDCWKWSSLAKTTPTEYDPVEKALTATTLENDSHIKMLDIKENHFNADEVRYVRIRMKTNIPKATNLDFYYANESGTGHSSQKSASASVPVSDEYIDYYLDMNGKTGWSGIIKDIRFDQINIADCQFWIKEITLLSAKAADTVTVNVHGVDFDFNTGFHKKSGDDIYVGGNPSDAFYSLHRFYYEWNRWTGELMIRTYTGHEFRFTVGSSKVLVDGAETTISEPIELADGLPMIPLKFIYDHAKYEYTVTETGFVVNIRGVDVSEILASRKENEFEFNIPGDTEGWRISGADGGVLNSGDMYFDATYNGTRYDPQIVLDDAEIPASDYSKAEIRYKAIYNDFQKNDQNITLYFGTFEDPSLNEQKAVSVSHMRMTPDEDGYYVLTLELSSHVSWVGTVTTLRLDPPNRDGEYFIDYIRLLK